MSKANKVTVLKSGIPKAKDIKEYSKQINVEIGTPDALASVLRNAIPELGRQIAKDRYDRGTLMKATELASSLYHSVDDTLPSSVYQLRATLAKDMGYEDSRWSVTDKCGNVKSFDFTDVYDGFETEIIIRVTAKPKDKKELENLGIK